MRWTRTAALACAASLTFGAQGISAGERKESFDGDPGWDGHQNELRSRTEEIRQDFGHSAATRHAGGAPGEAGGRIQPAGEPAYYAKVIREMTLDDPFSASGTLLVAKGGSHFLLGLFHAGTINEWRPPNSMVIRLNGRGDHFYAFADYATSRWRAGGDAVLGETPAGSKPQEKEIPSGVAYRWSFRYDPSGSGSLIVTIGDEKVVCKLTPEHRADGASFNRFGFLNVVKSFDGAGEAWIDDLEVNGAREDFSADPGWEGLRNRGTYRTANIRPQFDFGRRPTNHAAGRSAGELGGLIFRGDCRYPERLAAFGDRLGRLDLTQVLRASGKVALRRGVSDSTVLLGFYHSARSLASTPSQKSGFPVDFMGIAIEGPSRQGFYFYPVYRIGDDAQGYAGESEKPPHILPDGKPHGWTFEYDPNAAGGRGRIAVTLDRHRVEIHLGDGHKGAGAEFDRFGIVTTWIDGNAQEVYFDDLVYTASP